MGCYAVVLFLYGSGLLSITTLIQFPNATFILTYIGGCAAGIRLLKGSRMGVTISWISFTATVAVFPFTGWAIGCPIVIVACFTAIVWLRNSRSALPALPENEPQQKKSNVI
ncbi:hypothetical protein D3C81_2051580 [compost metagenome]